MTAINWIAEAASQTLSKTAVIAALKKFKPVSLDHYTAFKEGVVSLTLNYRGDGGVVSSAIFQLTPAGAKYTLGNLEITASIPGVREAGWKKVKLTDATGTLNQVMTGIVNILQDRAAKGVRRQPDSLGGGGSRKAAAPKAPTSAQSIEAAIKALEDQRDAAVKDFNARIEQLRNSHPATTGKKPAAAGALYGVDNAQMKAVYTRLFARPVPSSRKLSVKAGAGVPSIDVEVTHLVSNNVMLVDIPSKGKRQFLAVKGEGMWREDDSNLPTQYKKYL